VSIARDQATVKARYPKAVLRSIYMKWNLWNYQVLESRSKNALAVGEQMEWPVDAWRSAAVNVNNNLPLMDVTTK